MAGEGSGIWVLGSRV